MTAGERRFAAFCSQHGFPCLRIEETHLSKTADYRTAFGGVPVVIEIKDLTDNPAERQAANQSSKERWAIWGGSQIGSTIRNVIVSSHKQLKQYARERLPTILIVCDVRSLPVAILTSYEIGLAMYGYEELRATGDGGLSHRFGGRRQMTSGSRRYISAVGVLQSNLALDLFLNWHAQIPLPLESLTRLEAITLYAIEKDPCTRFSSCREVRCEKE